MSRPVLYSLLTFAVLTYINCDKTNIQPTGSEVKTEAPAPKINPGMKEVIDSKDDYDLMGVMRECNETFRVEMSFLEALNESGSFPDETDKTPKCYLKCVLQSLDIASEDGVLDPARTAKIFAGERNGTPMDGIEEIATNCAEQTKGISCKCEMAYSYLKCVFSMEIERYEKAS